MLNGTPVTTPLRRLKCSAFSEWTSVAVYERVTIFDSDWFCEIAHLLDICAHEYRRWSARSCIGSETIIGARTSSVAGSTIVCIVSSFDAAAPFFIKDEDQQFGVMDEN
ncbi:hypothetical protein BQ8482_220065 [Mesorhizobium delmotii]|uniref:Uncharacterized protein n=1 Tax=Mesorhizobium delmotii TaxID=1631247 RepID=A0A2P9AL73_9HYPH|nr:hypothetical protein BQ8482_220065 [Mesorhizobium delmotii]